MIFARDRVKIDFTYETWGWAVDFADAMFNDSKGKKRKNNHGIPEKENTDEENYRKVLQGAVAECAVYLHTGIEWHRAVGSVGNKSTLPDLGDDIQVRSSKPNRPFIYRRTDDEEQKFVFVWVNLEKREATIVGWLYGWECKEKGEWCDPQNRNNPIWSIHHMSPHPIDTLED